MRHIQQATSQLDDSAGSCDWRRGGPIAVNVLDAWCHIRYHAPKQTGTVAADLLGEAHLTAASIQLDTNLTRVGNTIIDAGQPIADTFKIFMTRRL